jgi:peptidoglycan/xylan/chitin deacetylase (PgdA/CDA1 family)
MRPQESAPLSGLYQANTPAAFWRLLPDSPIAPDVWSAAVRASLPLLPEATRLAGSELDSVLVSMLGEGQFGPHHWRLTAARRLYYLLKPLLPTPLRELMRRLGRGSMEAASELQWPIEPRYARFQWEVVRQVLLRTGRTALPYLALWPAEKRFAFAVTHDVESAEGQARVRELADLDASYGFRSSFNFVAERYPLDIELLDDLRASGFEIGLHGLKHDGRLFTSRAHFNQRAQAINRHLRRLGAVGFRAPLTHRNPEWMQALDVEYDLSFFDTDPYEPIPGGTMSIWPFQIGHFVELPYTLAQDFTVAVVLREKTPRLWLDKVAFLRSYGGMALVNTHPDYLTRPFVRQIYTEFLREMAGQRDYWHALPRDIASWWTARATAPSAASLPGAVEGMVELSYDRTGVVLTADPSGAQAHSLSADPIAATS